MEKNQTPQSGPPARPTGRILTSLLLALAIPYQLEAAGPAPLDLLSTAHFVILSGAAITTTGGGIINGDVGASPIAGSAIGVNCAQMNGTIYAVDASGPPCAVIASVLLTAAKNDLTTAYNDAAGRTPVPTGPNLNPGLIPGSGNLGGMNLAPGLYKFTTTALITGADVTLTGGPDDVWIFQCAQDLQLGSGIKVILAGGAQAKNIFWQVGTSAVLGTFSVCKGTILANQAITMNTSSTLEGRALAFGAGVTFNGTGAAAPGTNAPGIAVQQPSGTNLVNGAITNDFGSVAVGTNTSHTFTITNTGSANLTGLAITIDGADSTLFSVTTNPAAAVSPGGTTTFTVRFAPVSPGAKTAALHLANSDINNSPFNITLIGAGTGAGTVPGLVVQQPPGANLVNGGGKNFGPVAVGTNTSLVFTITNSGTAALTGLGITIDGSNSALFTVTANPAAPVGSGGTTTFTVRFAPVSPGGKTAVLHVANNDLNNNPFNLTLTGTGIDSAIVVSTNVFVVFLSAGVSPITLNPQTGLFEQTVQVTNNGSSTATAIRLFILNLPADVQVYNAGGSSSNGTPYVQYALPLAPATAVTFLIEYYRANRQTIPQPAFLVQETTPVTVTNTGPVMAVDRSVQLAGRFLIEFSAIPGNRYAVQYSSDLQTWQTAAPVITAPSNRVQWYDDGPPKTESKPATIGSRFYRVLALP
ncbi:MAG: ice-binding family protein [Verrucomicrobiae bacterium]|nr:ice-binding family protein [Verrucomicrobiae bacterium]